MPGMTKEDIKKTRPYALAMVPFFALYAYELATILPHRPSVPDLVHGYTIAMGSSGKPIYVSAGDLTLMLGTVFCAFAILAIGYVRAGIIRQFLRR